MKNPVLSPRNIYEILNKNDLLDGTKISAIGFSTTPYEVVFSSDRVEQCLQNQIPFFYFVRQGRRFNGHSLCEKIFAADQGVVGLKSQVEALAPKFLKNPLFFAVKDLERSLNVVLDTLYHEDLLPLKSMGVTGTNGKTSFVQIVGFLLEHLTNTKVLRMGTLGLQLGSVVKPTSHVTTPDYPTFLTALHQSVQEEQVSFAVVEATSHGLQEERLGNWLFDTVVFTNLTQDHLDYHGSMQAYRQAKHKLFSKHVKPHTGCAVVSTENEEWQGFLQQVKLALPAVVIGAGPVQRVKLFIDFCETNKIAPVCDFLGVEEAHHDLSGWRGTFVYKNTRVSWGCPLVGLFHLENILCAVSSLLTWNFPLSEIARALPLISGIPGRFQKVTVPATVVLPVVFVDYAHTPDALERVLQTARTLLPPMGKLWLVFGCGGDRDASKRPQMGRVAESLADAVILTSDNPRNEDPEAILDQIYAGFQKRDSPWAHRLTDRRAAIFKAIAEAQPMDLIVIAGKGHEKTQTIGTQSYLFSDEAVAQDALQERSKNAVSRTPPF